MEAIISIAVIYGLYKLWMYFCNRVNRHPMKTTSVETPKQKQTVKKPEQKQKLVYVCQNAEHDIIHYTHQLDELMELLWSLDDELANIDRQIRTNEQMRKEDLSLIKDRDKIKRKIISLETQIHTAENKLNKARFNKQQAQRTLKGA